MIRIRIKSAGGRSARTRRQPRTNLRARVALAFAEMANGVDPRTACSRTYDFYRSSGAEWVRNFAPISRTRG
jgi:hypothetical protein